MNKREILNGYLDIYSMNDNRTKYALDLDIFKENSKSIYAKGMYGNIYRLEIVHKLQVFFKFFLKLIDGVGVLFN